MVHIVVDGQYAYEKSWMVNRPMRMNSSGTNITIGGFTFIFIQIYKIVFNIMSKTLKAVGLNITQYNGVSIIYQFRKIIMYTFLCIFGFGAKSC